MAKKRSSGPEQLELPLAPRTRPPARLKLIRGGGLRKPEALASRDAVVRLLVEAGADLLLRRISAERAGEIEKTVDQVLRLFDAVDATPALMPVLRRALDGLEALMLETRALKTRKR